MNIEVFLRARVAIITKLVFFVGGAWRPFKKGGTRKIPWRALGGAPGHPDFPGPRSFPKLVSGGEGGGGEGGRRLLPHMPRDGSGRHFGIVFRAPGPPRLQKWLIFVSRVGAFDVREVALAA